MFESAEIGHKIDKETYRREEPRLREALLDAQFDLHESRRFATLVVIGGFDGAGKGETVNLFNEWMDPRHILTQAFPEPSEDERERPAWWRYWQGLPPRGRIGIYFGAWHTSPIYRRVERRLSAAGLEQSIAETLRFERMLTDEGVLLLKLWFHLSRQQQRKRLKELQKDPATRWRVGDTEWEQYRRYDRYRRVSEHYLRQTSSAEAPWMVIEGANPEYRGLTAGRLLLAALRERLDTRPVTRLPDKTPPLLPPIDRRNVIKALTLDQPMERRDYRRQLDKWQGRLNLASRHPRFGALSVVVVFEGNDAAGKGGAIRRVTHALDARCYRGVSIAAPTEEERDQPYLWRFWRQIPRRGRFALFDRSWYGRVLVERVEGYCTEADWMRAYSEINEFEHQLAAHHIVVVKFWLAISKEEQLKRFRAREKVAFKRFKITKDDWRNRAKWNAYEQAVCDMVERTSTNTAPWTLVEANNKHHARVKVLKTLTQAVEKALKRAKRRASD